MGGSKPIMLEDEHKVLKYRRLLPATETRPRPILQFFAVRGGLRTIAIDDIVDVS